MKLFGREYGVRELESYMADLRQLADIRLLTLEDGQERGVRVAQVRTGSGFDFTVLLDRAMDIGTATYNGLALAWHSGTGAAHPGRFEADGLNWLQTFHGGLLALCGLTQAGFDANAPVDPLNNEPLGLHGRIGTIPAHDVAIDRDITDGHIILRLRGIIDEVRLFGFKLRLQRSLEVTVGVPEVRIVDTVRNFGGTAAPLMLLYHCNFGWPLVSPDTLFHSPAVRVEPRDTDAVAGYDEWERMRAPSADFREQVYWHWLDRESGSVTTSLFNSALNVGVALDFDTRQLGYLTQWKQMGFGDYTLGIEPGNCLPVGRVAARDSGTLRMLPPGETDSFSLTLRVLDQRP